MASTRCSDDPAAVVPMALALPDLFVPAPCALGAVGFRLAGRQQVFHDRLARRRVRSPSDVAEHSAVA